MLQQTASGLALEAAQGGGREASGGHSPPAERRPSAEVGTNSGRAPGDDTSAAERALVRRVFEHCHVHIVLAVNRTLIPEEFLGALTANESAGDINAKRFEPNVYQRLKDVAGGRSAMFGAIDRTALRRLAEAVALPVPTKDHLTDSSGRVAAKSVEGLANSTDTTIRQLATSWGFTQIMGYHAASHGKVSELLDAERHYHHTVRLIQDFATRFKLDISRQFGELFCCWNTGRPSGRTFDPAYIPLGLQRMEIYREISEEARRAGLEPQPEPQSPS